MTDRTGSREEAALPLRTAKPFLILSLPRSRSAWLAHYLARGGEFAVGHDITVECDSISQFTDSYQNGLLGTVETGAVLAWQLIKYRLPDLQLVTVHRPLEEVLLSLARFGITPDEKELEAREAMLEACAEVPGTECLDWRDLDDPDCCKWLFELLLPEAIWDFQWHVAMSQINVQIDMFARVKRLWERKQQLDRLAAEIVFETGKIPRGERAWMQ